MKIACTYNSNYKNNIKALIDYMSEIGFSYIEFPVSKLPESEEEQSDIIEYALSRGFTLNLHAPYGINNISSADPECRASSIANVKHTIDLAAKHGLGAVAFHPGRLSNDSESPEANMKSMMEIVADIAQYAKEKKVFVAIENMERRPFELIYTVDDLNLFAPIAENNPYFGVTIDFAHYSSHNIGLPDLGELKLPIYDVHLSQYNGEKMHHHLLCDNGVVDIKEVCRMLSEYKYDGLIVLEIREYIKESKELLEDILANMIF